jgi:hypothetical protein
MQLRVLRHEGNDGGAGAHGAGRAKGPRPALTLIQGGAPRRGHRAASARLEVAPAPTPRPVAEEVPVYLKPIPSWVPRLW